MTPQDHYRQDKGQKSKGQGQSQKSHRGTMLKVQAKKRLGGEERSRREIRTRAASAQRLAAAAAARKSWEIWREAGKRQHNTRLYLKK